MTDNHEVQLLVSSHVETASNKFNRNFRRAYVGTDTPGAYERWGKLESGAYRKATLLTQILTIEPAYRDVSVFTESDLGAEITLISQGTKHEILEVLSTYEVRLDVSQALVIDPSTGISLVRPDTARSTADFVIDRSRSFKNRRITNIFSDRPIRTGSNGEAEVLQSKFIAAEVAGRRCSLLPQQGLTRTEIESIDAAPGMYARFTPELLDEIAANGTMIVTQEAAGTEVFIRHQLTTKADNGRALEYEDNIGVIVDEFSYAVKDLFKDFIGKRNATPLTITIIDNELKALADSFTQVDLVNADIGPAVLTFFDENGVEGAVTVRQDGDLADTLMTYVLLRVPLPLNGLNHYIDVEAASVLESEDNA